MRLVHLAKRRGLVGLAHQVLAVLALQLLQRVIVDLVDELLEAQQREDLKFFKKALIAL